MDLEIRALAPELAPDYFDFFENRAFTDGSPYRCYCQMFQASKAEAEAAYSGLAPEELGRAAGEQSLSRIENPDAPVFEKVLTSAYRPCGNAGPWGRKPTG